MQRRLLLRPDLDPALGDCSRLSYHPSRVRRRVDTGHCSLTNRSGILSPAQVNACAGRGRAHPPVVGAFRLARGASSPAAIESLVPPGETVLLLGPVPSAPRGWELKQVAQLAQMVCPTPIGELDGPRIIELSEFHRSDVLALTALVYPHYFRPRTTDLGRYFGIYQNGRLGAMIGERMGMEDYTEIRAATPPRLQGQGTRGACSAGVERKHERGRPVLNVSQQNHGHCSCTKQWLRLRREIAYGRCVVR